MTREEAIWWVNHLFEIRKEEYWNKGAVEDAKEVETAQNMAIEALSEPSGDLISRADAVKALEEYHDWHRAEADRLAEDIGNSSRYEVVRNNILAEGLTEARDVIYQLPSAESVQVVRCKDCKHQEHCHETVSHTKIHDDFQEHWSETIEWCSRGERKGGDTE